MAQRYVWTLADLQALGYQMHGETARQPHKSLTAVAAEDPEASPAADMPEALLLAHVRQLAKTYAWELYHTYRSTKSEPGFPDVVLTDGTSLLMMELKTNTGKPTADQARWLSLLAHTGQVECGIWRPRDMPRIAARLSRREA